MTGVLAVGRRRRRRSTVLLAIARGARAVPRWATVAVRLPIVGSSSRGWRGAGSGQLRACALALRRGASSRRPRSACPPASEPEAANAQTAVDERGADRARPRPADPGERRVHPAPRPRPAPPVARPHPLRGVGRPGAREPRGGRQPPLHDAAPRRHGGRGRRHPHGRSSGRRPGSSFVATAAELHAAIREPGAMARTAHHPAGERTGAQLLEMRVLDVTVHTWDLARAIGADESLDPDPGRLRAHATRHVRGGPRARLLRPAARGTPADFSAQARLLHLSGRRPSALEAIAHHEDASD